MNPHGTTVTGPWAGSQQDRTYSPKEIEQAQRTSDGLIPYFIRKLFREKRNREVSPEEAKEARRRNNRLTPPHVQEQRDAEQKRLSELTAEEIENVRRQHDELIPSFVRKQRETKRKRLLELTAEDVEELRRKNGRGLPKARTQQPRQNEDQLAEDAQRVELEDPTPSFATPAPPAAAVMPSGSAMVTAELSKKGSPQPRARRALGCGTGGRAEVPQEARQKYEEIRAQRRARIGDDGRPRPIPKEAREKYEKMRAEQQAARGGMCGTGSRERLVSRRRQQESSPDLGDVLAQIDQAKAEAASRREQCSRGECVITRQSSACDHSGNCVSPNIARFGQDTKIDTEPPTPEEAADKIQSTLDVAGMVEGPGMLADIANAIISLFRGKPGEAATNAASALPVVGAAVGGVKILKHADEAAALAKNSDEVVGAVAKSGGKWVSKYWDTTTHFKGKTVYQRNDIFDPEAVSSWKVKGRTVTGTNVERMASGRAPIGTDGKPVNLHHLTQTEAGSIAEVPASLHQEHYRTLHINTGDLPSGINRAEFDAWRSSYWANRADGF